MYDRRDRAAANRAVGEVSAQRDAAPEDGWDPYGVWYTRVLLPRLRKAPVRGRNFGAGEGDEESVTRQA